MQTVTVTATVELAYPTPAFATEEAIPEAWNTRRSDYPYLQKVSVTGRVEVGSEARVLEMLGSTEPGCDVRDFSDEVRETLDLALCDAASDAVQKLIDAGSVCPDCSVTFTLQNQMPRAEVSKALSESLRRLDVLLQENAKYGPTTAANLKAGWLEGLVQQTRDQLDCCRTCAFSRGADRLAATMKRVDAQDAKLAQVAP